MIVSKNLEKGFSLFEMLLVLAIASSILLMAINYTTQKGDQVRIDKAALQMQQVLNAAAAFYVNNSRWPGSATGAATYTGAITELIASGYLPSNATTNPWFRTIWTASPIPTVGSVQGLTQAANAPRFYVTSITGTNSVNNAKSQATAQAVAGKLPFGFITDYTHWDYANQAAHNPPTPQTTGCTAGDGCSYAVASISIPGQNLNNARSINYAGIYHSGACVPAPVCPTGTSPQILVAAVQVSGVYDPVTCSGSPLVCTGNYYPITSFTAFAKGGDASGAPTTGWPLTCEATTSNPGTLDCNHDYSPLTESSPAGYWRVCLVVVTNKGQAYPGFGTGTESWTNSYEHGKMLGSVLAVTRCVPNNGNESPVGSDFTVFGPNAGWAK